MEKYEDKCAKYEIYLPIPLFQKKKTGNLIIKNPKFCFIWKCFVKELSRVRRKKSQEISCFYCSKVIVTRDGFCTSQIQTHTAPRVHGTGVHVQDMVLPATRISIVNLYTTYKVVISGLPVHII